MTLFLIYSEKMFNSHFCSLIFDLKTETADFASPGVSA